MSDSTAIISKKRRGGKLQMGLWASLCTDISEALMPIREAITIAEGSQSFLFERSSV